jgi:hypothetical protein
MLATTRVLGAIGLLAFFNAATGLLPLNPILERLLGQMQIEEGQLTVFVAFVFCTLAALTYYVYDGLRKRK